MSADTAYLDSSAIVKLLLDEPGSTALRAWLPREWRHVSSALVRTEVARAARRSSTDALDRVMPILARIDLIGIDDSLLTRAGAMQPAQLRSLDAIHLAAALSLEDDLGALVTYDLRMVEAARANGIPVVTP